MITPRQLKIDLLKDRNDYTRLVQHILAELFKIDRNASLLTTENSIASRTLVKKLWDALPDEHESYQFNGTSEQTAHAAASLPVADPAQNVTLHLGWDLLCFSCSFKAAWHAWDNFNTINTDTFNSCIYPEDLEWYIVRAGNNLYPMNYSDDGYVLLPANKIR